MKRLLYILTIVLLPMVVTSCGKRTKVTSTSETADAEDVWIDKTSGDTIPIFCEIEPRYYRYGDWELYIDVRPNNDTLIFYYPAGLEFDADTAMWQCTDLHLRYSYADSVQVDTIINRWSFSSFVSDADSLLRQFDLYRFQVDWPMEEENDEWQGMIKVFVYRPEEDKKQYYDYYESDYEYDDEDNDEFDENEEDFNFRFNWFHWNKYNQYC